MRLFNIISYSCSTK